jgi:hypothetical protein
MHVRVQIGDRLFNRTRTSGDSLKGNAERLGVPTDVLPLLFNQKLVGDGGTKHMKAFLSSAATDRFDPKVAFVADPEMTSMLRQANMAGALTTKQVIAFFERQRAAQQPPPAPVVPGVPCPPQSAVDTLQAEVRAADLEASGARKEAEELQELTTAVSAALQYYRALSAWEVVAATVAAGDPLGGTRTKVQAVSAISTAGIRSVEAVLVAAGKTELAEVTRQLASQLDAAVAEAKATLASFPPPPTLPPKPSLSPAHQAKTDLLGVRDEAAASGVLKALADEYNGQKTKADALTAKATQLARATREAQEGIGAWKAYEAAMPLYDDAVVRSKVEWNRWDKAVKLVEVAEAEHRQKVGNSFAELVGDLSGLLLQGRKVTISAEDGIKIGADPIDLLSESTRWRAEVATLAAIAAITKSPLLVIDGADILDDKNKVLFVQFLLERIAPNFEHVIVTSTVRGRLEDEQPSQVPGLTKWTISKGELVKLEKAV